MVYNDSVSMLSVESIKSSVLCLRFHFNLSCQLYDICHYYRKSIHRWDLHQQFWDNRRWYVSPSAYDLWGPSWPNNQRWWTFLPSAQHMIWRWAKFQASLPCHPPNRWWKDFHCWLLVLCPIPGETDRGNSFFTAGVKMDTCATVRSDGEVSYYRWFIIWSDVEATIVWMDALVIQSQR